MTQAQPTVPHPVGPSLVAPRLGSSDLATVARLEGFSLAAVPARTSWEVPGWWCVADDGGHVGRANSATAVRVPEGASPASLEAVARSYRARGLPPKVRWTPVAPASVAVDAQASGWRSAGEVVVMVAAGSGRTSDGAPLPPGVEVRLLSAPDDGWTGVYLDANADGSGPARLRLAVEAPQKKAYASITVEGVTAAIGLGVVLDGTLGVFDVVTAPTYRRRGLARLVMGSLRRWGADAGATSSFLQVHGGNAGAIALYESLGFTTGYTYVYLVPPPTTE